MGSKVSFEEFERKSNIVHENKFIYLKESFSRMSEKVKIICPEHGEFEQHAGNHMKGVGCSKCSGKYKPTTEEFIERANVVHNNKYDYSLVIYKNKNEKVKIICPIHGEFLQVAERHLKHGCFKCGIIQTVSQTRTTLEEFIERANVAHNNKYDYSLVIYKNNSTKVKIICPTHGEFEQSPAAHIRLKQGCPICNESFGEREIVNFLLKNQIIFERQKKFDGCKNVFNLTFDFFIPENNICIEYQGIQHYKPIEIFGGEEQLIKQRKNDKIKKEFCRSSNIKLLEIKYTDFNKIHAILEEKIT